jgi:hypothetical protein
MAGLGWSMSVVMQEHLQNLVSLGYITATELATCRVPKDPTSPVSTWGGGYVMVCAMFYEGGFVVPSQRFLRSLLQFYSLEMHHLTPSGILHMAAFVTLCEAYMGITPHVILWNYFFTPGYDRAQMWKRWYWAVWISMYDLGPMSIPIFLFPCPTLRSGGGGHGS